MAGCGRNLGRDGADLDTRTRHFVTGVFVVVIFNRNVGQTDTAGVVLVKLQSGVRAVQYSVAGLVGAESFISSDLLSIPFASRPATAAAAGG